jgi:hypothetical protein
MFIGFPRACPYNFTPLSAHALATLRACRSLAPVFDQAAVIGAGLQASLWARQCFLTLSDFVYDRLHSTDVFNVFYLCVSFRTRLGFEL